MIVYIDGYPVQMGEAVGTLIGTLRPRQEQAMATIHVPDVPVPTAQLCWKQSPSMVRCDRRVGHQGSHTWEPFEIQIIEADAATQALREQVAQELDKRVQLALKLDEAIFAQIELRQQLAQVTTERASMQVALLAIAQYPQRDMFLSLAPAHAMKAIALEALIACSPTS